MSKYAAIAIFSGMLTAFAQVLLKKSSNINYSSGIREYLNPYVISGYGITFICMILMVIAFKGLPLKYGAVIESLTYIYIMIMGKVFFNERITLKKILGNMTIVCGVIVFSMG